jgi:hypothetical protein
MWRSVACAKPDYGPSHVGACQEARARHASKCDVYMLRVSEAMQPYFNARTAQRPCQRVGVHDACWLFQSCGLLEEAARTRRPCGWRGCTMAPPPTAQSGGTYRLRRLQAWMRLQSSRPVGYPALCCGRLGHPAPPPPAWPSWTCARHCTAQAFASPGSGGAAMRNVLQPVAQRLPVLLLLA